MIWSGHGAFGADAPGVLQQVLGAAGKSGGPFAAEVSIARFAPLDKDKGPAAKKVAAEVFGSDPHGDEIRVTVEGGPALRVRASMKGLVVKFGVKMNEAAMGRAEP